eukprot:364415-Chlamydomonas_euryale.AAC.6
MGCSKTFRGAHALTSADAVRYWLGELATEMEERLQEVWMCGAWERSAIRRRNAAAAAAAPSDIPPPTPHTYNPPTHTTHTPMPYTPHTPVPTPLHAPHALLQDEALHGRQATLLTVSIWGEQALDGGGGGRSGGGSGGAAGARPSGGASAQPMTASKSCPVRRVAASVVADDAAGCVRKIVADRCGVWKDVGDEHVGYIGGRVAGGLPGGGYPVGYRCEPPGGGDDGP